MSASPATMQRDVASRNDSLAHWDDAPQARAARPREEHLIPLMVAAGTAGSDPATRIRVPRS